MGRRKSKCLPTSQGHGCMLAIESLGEDCIFILHALLYICFHRKVLELLYRNPEIILNDWNPLKVIAVLEILHFVVHQSKKGIKKYYEANPDALKISEVKFFNPYESEKYRRKNFRGSIRTIESEKWLNWPVNYIFIIKKYVNINKTRNFRRAPALFHLLIMSAS